jgi:hypothetical protein
MVMRGRSIGAEVQRELSGAYLDMLAEPRPARARAQLGLFWERVLVRFKLINSVKAESPVERKINLKADAQVSGMIAGWAVGSLLDRCSKPRAHAADAALVPLLKRLLVPEWATQSERNPVVLNLLARQQFGGLRAVTSSALTAFALAQANLSAHLTQEDIYTHKQYAYTIAMTHAKRSEAVKAAFDSLFDCADASTSARCINELLSKFFNSGAEEHRQQVESLWARGEAKGEGVGICTDLKVMQKKAANKIETEYPIVYEPEKALRLPFAQLHRLLVMVIELAPTQLTENQKVSSEHLRCLVSKYTEGQVSKKLTKVALVKKLSELVSAREPSGAGASAAAAAAPATDASASADASAVAAAAAPKSPARLRPQPLATRSPNVMAP